MRLWKMLVRRLKVWSRPEKVEREMEKEIRFHLDMETEDHLRLGLEPEEARTRAVQEFGGVERHKEEARHAYGGRAAADFVRDLRYAARSLRKSPGVGAAAVLTLALGLGGFAAIYSVLDAVLLDPLPFRDADRLVRIWSSNPVQGRERYFVSPSDLADWRERSRALQGIAGFWPNQVTVVRPDGEPVRVLSSLTTADYFGVLGLEAHLGRTFIPADGAPGAPEVMVLSHRAWERHFGADPGVVGSTVTVDERSLEVVGVLEPGLVYPPDLEMWTNINFALATSQGRGPRWMSTVGRLAPGATLEGARRDLGAVAAELAREFPAANGDWGVQLEPVPEELLGDVSQKLWILLGATGLILLIACVNVANLMLSRAEGRRREMALRTALGAGRRRLARQLLSESLLLAGLGGGLGLALAWGATDALTRIGPPGVPRLESVALDGGVLAVGAAATVLTALLFGLAPTLGLLRGELVPALKEGGRGSRGPEARRLRGGFVMAQVAMAGTLLVGAGLLVKSFDRLAGRDAGFRAGGVLTFQLNLSGERYPDLGEVTTFYHRLLDGAEGLPGVTGASMTSSLPLGEQADYQVPFGIVGREAFQDGERNQVYHRQVGPGFFGVMGTRVVAGRELTDQDRLDGRPVVVVNRALARLYWPDGDPVGERVRVASGNYGPLGSVLVDEAEIVGVVDDLLYEDLRVAPEPAIYFPHRQAPFRQMTVVVRTSDDPARLVPAVRSLVGELDPGLPLSRIRAMEEVVSTSVATERFTALLLGAFALTALILAAIGIYGVLAYSVSRRTAEVGIRMALGAGALAVVGMVMRQSMVRVAGGLALGLLAALTLSRFLESQLFGVTARDPGVFGVVVAVLAGVALLASYLPARRAARVDPVRTLREE